MPGTSLDRYGVTEKVERCTNIPEVREMLWDDMPRVKEKYREEGIILGRIEGHNEGRIEGRIEGRNEGRIEGRDEGMGIAAFDILSSMLEDKFGALPEYLLARLQGIDDLPTSVKLSKILLKAETLEDFIVEMNRICSQ